MKTIFHKFFLILLIAFGKTASAQMVLEYDVDTSFYRQIVLPLAGTVNVSVDWGDGSIESFTTAGNKSHTFTTSGTKTVTITGSLTAYGSNTIELGKARLSKVLSWDGLGIASFSYAFYGTGEIQVPSNLPSTVTDLSHMFENSSFNQPIGSWNTAAVTNMAGMFNGAIYFNKPIGTWNTAAVTNMSMMFSNATAFNQPIGTWNTAAVTDMSGMFEHATTFNQPIGSWNTESVTNMSGMFHTSSFNQPIGSWNTAAVTNMLGMFSATSFNQPIGTWNTAAVTNMSMMFSDATAFNQPIGTWNTAAVTNMSIMFYNAKAFNQPIGTWNTAAVTNMDYLFYKASSFNQPIGSWNTAAVTRMTAMFFEATSFNQPIEAWNTSAVTEMYQMFYSATSFNQPIGKWNTSQVTLLDEMFHGASAFNQSVGTWKLNPDVSLTSMFDYSGIDCNNYGSTLIGWANDPDCPTGKFLGAENITYDKTGNVARTLLTTPIANGGKLWHITGDVLVKNCVSSSSEDHSSTTLSSISISPNPSNNGDFVINSNKTITEVIVTDLSGKQERFFDTQNIHTELKGLLHIRAIADNDIEIQKVVVQ